MKWFQLIHTLLRKKTENWIITVSFSIAVFDTQYDFHGRWIWLPIVCIPNRFCFSVSMTMFFLKWQWKLSCSQIINNKQKLRKRSWQRLKAIRHIVSDNESLFSSTWVVCKTEFDAKRRGCSEKLSEKLIKNYTISMGVHRKENFIL